MRRALRNGEFYVYYQPLISFATGRCIGVEALLRRRCAGGAFITPDVFIAQAEQHGFIAALTDHVISTSIADLAVELSRYPDWHLAINISAQDLQSGRILAVLDATVASYTIRPQQIWLEVSERGFRDLAAVRPILAQARARGYVIAIDDFGTGYSSLSCLEALPIDILKIDKSFVTDNVEQGKVLTHIITLGKSLEMKIVAEGIETTTQARWLRDAGVEYGQGWLYAKAMPVTELVMFLDQSNTMKSALPESTQDLRTACAMAACN